MKEKRILISGIIGIIGLVVVLVLINIFIYDLRPTVRVWDIVWLWGF